MFWNICLTVLTVIFSIIAVTSFIVSLFSEFEIPETLIIFLVAAAIAVGCGWGAFEIKAANTVTTTEVVEMEVQELNMTKVYKNYGDKVDYYMLVTSENLIFNIKVDLKTYATYSIGDIIPVEITTKQIFNNITQTANLGGIEKRQITSSLNEFVLIAERRELEC